SRFHFTIKYRPGKANTLADALSRPERNPEEKTGDHRVQVLLKSECLDPQILEELEELRPEALASVLLAPIDTSMAIIDQILQANRSATSLEKHRSEAASSDDWTMENGLLLFKGRLVVPTEEDD